LFEFGLLPHVGQPTHDNKHSVLNLQFATDKYIFLKTVPELTQSV